MSKRLWKKVANAESSTLTHKKNALESLYCIYKENNTIDSTLLYLNRFNNVGLELANRENGSMTLNIERRFNQSIIELNDKNLVLRNYTYLSFILAMLIILIVSLLVRLWKQKTELLLREKKNELLKWDLKMKESELLSFLERKLRISELVENTNVVLEELQQVLPNEYRNEILSIIRNNKLADYDRNIWEEFEIRFNTVNGDLLRKVLEAHKDITNNEKRLCAFISMNMTTKEISELTGQSKSALEQARARLRKKFGITNSGIEIGEYLSKFN